MRNIRKEQIARLKKMDPLKLADACKLDRYTCRRWLDEPLTDDRLKILLHGADEVEYIQKVVRII